MLLRRLSSKGRGLFARLALRFKPISREVVNASLAREGLADNAMELFAQRCATIEDYRAYIAADAATLASRARFERHLVRQSDAFSVQGYCAVCSQDSTFAVDFLYAQSSDRAGRIPNWRERLVCHTCKLTNRQRAMVDFVRSRIALGENAALYVTEQTTPFFRALKHLYPKAVGSELLRDKTPAGAVNQQGIRNENLTRLSFSDVSLDAICTADVLEHVPAYREAISECYRCLKPGGRIVITVPFLLDSSETLVRARIAGDGSVEHLLPPEYHGDPLDQRGVLCYYHFGWDLLDVLRESGFADVGLYFYWSPRRAYLGSVQFLICAAKPQT